MKYFVAATSSSSRSQSCMEERASFENGGGMIRKSTSDPKRCHNISLEDTKNVPLIFLSFVFSYHCLSILLFSLLNIYIKNVTMIMSLVFLFDVSTNSSKNYE